jgi:hypothetical protein
MTSLAATTALSEKRRARRVLFMAFAVLPMLGLLWAASAEAGIGYLLLTISVYLPCSLWVRAGTPGIPIWPAVAVMSWLYYALPILRDRENLYTPDEILRGAATAAAFLTIGTITWRLSFPSGRRRPRRVGPEFLVAPHMNAVVFLGLGLGLSYYVLLSLGLFNSLGSAFGLVRSFMQTSAVVSCYVVGHARGRGILRGQLWALAVAALTANALAAWTSLFLVQGMSYLLAAVGGYVITTKRVPWLPLSAAFLILGVLHAGKTEMRQQYWLADSNTIAESVRIQDVPEFLTEWIRAGLKASVSDDGSQSIIDRASLFRLLLAVQRLAPESVPFLDGETYALLPNLLVPRFLEPDKIVSQAGMNMLNIHFGFQTDQQTKVTALGWGLIPEAYANFGTPGVAGIGLLSGMIAGLFFRFTWGASAISTGTFLGIVALMTMINLETDLSYLLTNLWQTCVSVWLLLTAWRLLGLRANPSYGAIKQRLVA